MPWVHLISNIFGGAFLINAVPHLVSRRERAAVPDAVRRSAGAGAVVVDR